MPKFCLVKTDKSAEEKGRYGNLCRGCLEEIIKDHKLKDIMSTQVASTTEVSNQADVAPEVTPQMIYRCKKCRRIVASQENIVSHERGEGQKCFTWKKRTGDTTNEAPECSSIFVEPMKWMQAVEEGSVEQKLQCFGCNARLGSFNWAGMQCNCGAWVNPAFQLHKSRMDECRF